MDSADVLEEMEDEDAAMLAELLPSEQLADILDEMESDEAADVLGDLSQEKVTETLREMDEPEDVIPLLRYPDDTAGGLMTQAVITLRQDWTAEEALAELRRVGPVSESTYYLFVVDEDDRLLGVIGLRDLVTMPIDMPIAERMKTDVVSVLVTTDQEECARVLSRHGYMALPVVDEIGRFLGVITADDLIEVTEDEATEDMYRMVGITGEEERVFGSVRSSIFKRLPWLAVNMLTLFIAITVVDAFEAVIAGMVALAVFLPLVSGEGGNAGSQTATVIVRGIALGEITPSDGMRCPEEGDAGSAGQRGFDRTGNRGCSPYLERGLAHHDRDLPGNDPEFPDGCCHRGVDPLGPQEDESRPGPGIRCVRHGFYRYVRVSLFPGDCQFVGVVFVSE